MGVLWRRRSDELNNNYIITIKNITTGIDNARI